MDLADYFEYYLGPVSDDEQRCIGVVEEGDVKNASVLVNEVIEAYPLLFVDCLVDHVNFFLIVLRQSDALLALSKVHKYIHLVLLLLAEVFLIIVECIHEVSVDLQL